MSLLLSSLFSSPFALLFSLFIRLSSLLQTDMSARVFCVSWCKLLTWCPRRGRAGSQEGVRDGGVQQAGRGGHHVQQRRRALPPQVRKGGLSLASPWPLLGRSLPRPNTPSHCRNFVPVREGTPSSTQPTRPHSSTSNRRPKPRHCEWNRLSDVLTEWRVNAVVYNALLFRRDGVVLE